MPVFINLEEKNKKFKNINSSHEYAILYSRRLFHQYLVNLIYYTINNKNFCCDNSFYSK